ncbi:Catechol 1,2-dioxygenase [Vanrija pseudolonga]|uniref:Catechol 1,2-dioxygenase n=1 Tax=Vanrija pseudolonga TaxID=143232 RepID=A0AAF1BKP1_9TREE|nr:Catechol 1,2-dioxygenase [Vanrija pseudolonga]
MSNIDFSAYTDSVVNAIGPKASPRVKEAFPILIRKIHEFLIEADVTTEEWMEACNLMVEAGAVSSEKRNEVVLVTDVLGIESLVNTLDQTRVQRKAANGVASSSANPTDSAILGPFYRAGVPLQPNGTCIIRQDEPGAPYTHLYGRIFGADGKPLADALVDIWHDAPDGFYDAQSPEKPEYHCRGRFKTDAEGRYDTVCLRPTAYPIPFDHSAGKLLQMMDRHPYRPAHIHFWVEAEGHKTLVTQIFDSDSDYLTDDAVFAVRDKLIVHFQPISKSYTPPKDCEGKMKFELEQDFHLQKAE